jgi:hypothetical protein
MYRVNRYQRGGVWRWRVWKGAELIAKSPRGYTERQYGAMERTLRALFPHWVK